MGLFLSLFADYHALRRIKRRIRLDYAKLETNKNTKDHVSLDYSSTREFSVTNDNVETCIKSVKESKTDDQQPMEINEPVVPQKVRNKAKY